MIYCHKIMCGLAVFVAVMSSQGAKGERITVEDFQGNEVIEDFEALPFGGNASPLSLGGNMFTTDDPFFRVLNVSLTHGMTGRGLGTNNEFGFIDVVLGTPVLRAGAVVGVDGAWSATVSFFDQNDVEIGTILESRPGNPDVTGTGVFVGWEADSGLIKRIRFTDTFENPDPELIRITLIDDFTTEVIPEPQSLILMCAGLLITAMPSSINTPLTASNHAPKLRQSRISIGMLNVSSDTPSIS
jgi:hypothetical protein